MAANSRNGIKSSYETRYLGRRAATLHGGENVAGNNPLWQALEGILKDISADIGSNDDLLKSCFTTCYDGNVNYDRYLGDVPFECGLSPGFSGVNYIAEPFFLDAYINARRWDPNTILLALDIGYGKTTLLKYYFRIWLPNNLHIPETENIAVIWIDCSNAPCNVDEAENWFTSQVAKTLATAPAKYCDGKIVIYSGAGIFVSQPTIDRIELEGALRTLASGTRLCVILDNVDTVPDEPTQKQLYISSNTLFDQIHCLKIVTAREYSIEPWRSTRVDHHHRCYTLPAPSIDDAVRKRVYHLLSTVDDIDIHIKDPHSGVTYTFDDIQHVIIGLAESLGNEAFAVLRFAANGNMRRLFDNLAHVLASYHFSGADVFRHVIENAVHRSRNIPLPYNEPARILAQDVIRSLALGPLKSFDPRRSELVNLYDSQFSRTHYVFLRLRLLAYIGEHGWGIATDTLLEDLAKIGYCREGIVKELAYLVDRGLIRNTLYASGRFDTGAFRSVMLTGCGQFYLDYLATDVEYLQAIHKGTRVDQDAFVAVGREEATKTERIRATHKFIIFLQREEELEEEYIRSVGNFELYRTFFHPVRNALGKSIRRAAEKLRVEL
jgi:hypothetical protein